MSAKDRKPGWDKRAVNRIAKEAYGGLQQMFDAHDWETDGKLVSQVAPSRVKETYGSVEKFEREHETKDTNTLADPWSGISASPPNVWLTSFYGFEPERWGFLGFSREAERRRFIRETSPGALVVVYGQKTKAPKNQRGMVIGILQVSHQRGNAQSWMDPSEWMQKEADSGRAGKWNLALKATRAWKVTEESYISIDDFAPETYSAEKAQTIGSFGMQLTQGEAKKLLKLKLVATTVFGEIPIEAAVPCLGSEAFEPSRPGPVSQSGHFCREAEGPKSLYIMRLKGDESNFLGYSAGDRWIIKIGMSGSPSSRCTALNAALPTGTYKWEIIKTNQLSGRQFFPNSKLAIAAETSMKVAFHQAKASLGGEFFIADEPLINSVWHQAIQSSPA
jgi:hypothetical protein